MDVQVYAQWKTSTACCGEWCLLQLYNVQECCCRRPLWWPCYVKVSSVCCLEVVVCFCICSVTVTSQICCKFSVECMNYLIMKNRKCGSGVNGPTDGLLLCYKMAVTLCLWYCVGKTTISKWPSYMDNVPWSPQMHTEALMVSVKVPVRFTAVLLLLRWSRWRTVKRTLHLPQKLGVVSKFCQELNFRRSIRQWIRLTVVHCVACLVGHARSQWVCTYSRNLDCTCDTTECGSWG